MSGAGMSEWLVSLSIDMASVRAIRTGHTTGRSSGGRTISSWSGAAGAARGGRSDAWYPGELGAGDGIIGGCRRSGHRMFVVVRYGHDDHDGRNVDHDRWFDLVQRTRRDGDPDRRGVHLVE